jgi:hypothetical protein
MYNPSREQADADREAAFESGIPHGKRSAGLSRSWLEPMIHLLGGEGSFINIQEYHPRMLTLRVCGVRRQVQGHANNRLVDRQ